MRWVMVVTVDTDEPELRDLAEDLKARFGERVRTRTLQGWLYDAERAKEPEPPVLSQRTRPFYGVSMREPRRQK